MTAGTVKTPVTVLGLGSMGAALARALLAAGHPTTVWNRSLERAGPVVAAGAVRADTPADAVAASPTTIVSLIDYDAVDAVLDRVGDALDGRVLVILTNGSPEQARDTAARAERLGAAGYLDGGIMAVPSMIGDSGAMILYSGDGDEFATHQNTLAALGTAVYVGADYGLASLYDLALLSAMYGMFSGFLHAAALVGTEQIPATGFTTQLLAPFLEAMIGALPELAGQIDSGDYRSNGSTLEMQTSAMDLVMFSERRGVSGALIAPLLDLMRQRVAQGYGDHDLSSIIDLIRAPASG